MGTCENGWEDSAEAWVRHMDDQREISRKQILDAPMLELCGNLAGTRVLDVGCGEGRFCRMLAERGALVTGIDPTRSLLAAARLRHPAGEYLEAVAEELPFGSGSFDLVISYLTLIDIPGYREAIAEMARTLLPGGWLLIANLNGFITGHKHTWERCETGEKLHWTVDDYMVERSTWAEWAGIRIKNFHRPHGAYMQALLAEGLVLEHYSEPLPRPEAGAEEWVLKEYRENLRAPLFHIMRWRKPA